MDMYTILYKAPISACRRQNSSQQGNVHSSDHSVMKSVCGIGLLQVGELQLNF